MLASTYISCETLGRSFLLLHGAHMNAPAHPPTDTDEEYVSFMTEGKTSCGTTLLITELSIRDAARAYVACIQAGYPAQVLRSDGTLITARM